MKLKSQLKFLDGKKGEIVLLQPVNNLQNQGLGDPKCIVKGTEKAKRSSAWSIPQIQTLSSLQIKLLLQ